MEVKVLKAFYDREGGVTREAGSSFACTDKRMREVNEAFPGTLESERRTVRKKVSKEV